jgi:hypothetical protein
MQDRPNSPLHTPLPLQDSVVSEHDGIPLGSSSDKGTGAHAPTLPERLQVMHVSVHEALQQTPSTQKPVVQSDEFAHVLPRSVHCCEAPLHTPLSQLLSGSDKKGTARHCPVGAPVLASTQDWHWPSQLLSQQTPSMQKPLTQPIAVVQGSPFFCWQ